MKKLGLVAAVVMLLSVLAVGIAAAAAMPGANGAAAREASASTSRTAGTDAEAVAAHTPLITDERVFAQFGFCDDVDSSPSY